MDDDVLALIRQALAEDLGSGDVTAEFFVPAERMVQAVVVARAEGVVSGVELAARVFREVDAGLDIVVLVGDGGKVQAGTRVLQASGRARAILAAERTALNFLQHLSGVATLTDRYVAAVAGTGARILDTRKTTPGWRALEKKAVLDGGGTNHRMGLFDRVMVKDNHLSACGSLADLQVAIRALKHERPDLEIQLEADTLDQVRKFLGLAGVDHILLDNMTPDDLRRAVAMRGARGLPLLEASGGVKLDTVREIALAGVDFVSVGALTHSAPALDLGLDFVGTHGA